MKNAFCLILKALFALKIFKLLNYAENEAGKLVPVCFLFFKKDLHKVTLT